MHVVAVESDRKLRSVLSPAIRLPFSLEFAGSDREGKGPVAEFRQSAFLHSHNKFITQMNAGIRKIPVSSYLSVNS